MLPPAPPAATPSPQQGFLGTLWSRLRGEFAEFLQYYSSKRLSILCAPTGVGLRYSAVLRCRWYFFRAQFGAFGMRWETPYSGSRGPTRLHFLFRSSSCRQLRTPAGGHRRPVVPFQGSPRRLLPPSTLNVATLRFGHGTHSPASSGRPSTVYFEPRGADSADLPAEILGVQRRPL